ncbi:diguanylate cyclase domain-containing protein [Marinobacter sp. DUT-1]|uniref:diguanylate cyclase domain-containing protein n=1 Tax=Marinobacter sp. DUT-1 TaxID=3412037 RepID=UPI003D177415
MDITEHKRHIIITAVVAVVLTGILVATIVATPLINQIHSRAELSAANFADAEAASIRAAFDQHRNLAAQTASRSELARRLAQYHNGEITRTDLADFTRPRLGDAAEGLTNLRAIVRYDADGSELVRIGPMADRLPARLPLREQLDILTYPLDSGVTSPPLLHVDSPITFAGKVVGYDLLLFSLDSLRSIFEGPENSQICLLDKDRTKRITINKETGQFVMLPADPCLAKQLNIQTGIFGNSFRATLEDGTRVMSFLRPLPDYPWEVHVWAEVNEIFGTVIRDIVFSVMVTLVLSLLAGFLVWRSLRPVLQRIAQQASELARSNDELQQAQRKIRRQADHDLLTSLPNRAAILKLLEHAIDQAHRDNSRFALMFVDLDHFKPVNDRYGHQAGDELLKVIAKRLEGSVRDEDVVGRHGGDEFLVITAPLDNTDDAFVIAEKITAVAEQPFRIKDHAVQVGASVGVAIYPDNGTTVTELLQASDAAMYQAKDSGRGGVSFA